jgi:MarR family 2-MHQ and catechol resistance regulon transcriptional repressor
MTQRANLDDDRLTLMGLLVEVMAGVEAATGAQLAEHGLTWVEFGVLVRLSRSPGQRLRMSDLTAQTSLTNSGITRVVDRLSNVGLVRREACPIDRRSTYAVLTAVGLERVEAALPGHLEVVHRWLVSPLTPSQQADFVSALRTVRDEVRPDATAGAGGASDEHATAPALSPA